MSQTNIKSDSNYSGEFGMPLPNSTVSVFKKSGIDVYFVSNLLERHFPHSIIASILNRSVDDPLIKKAIEYGYHILADQLRKEKKAFRRNTHAFWRKTVGLIVSPQLTNQSIKFNFVKSVNNQSGKTFESIRDGRGFILNFIEIIQTITAIQEKTEFKAYHKHPKAADGVGISFLSSDNSLRISLNGDKKYYIALSEPEKQIIFLILLELRKAIVSQLIFS